jgi:type IV pilus assembly protein PilC
MKELNNTVGVGARPAVGSRAVAGDAARFDGARKNEAGFSFKGVDSLGNMVKGVTATTDPLMAVRELERAGIRLEAFRPAKGSKTTDKMPTGVELATLAEQFGDLMEIGESPTQVCRLLALAQTNKTLTRALVNAGELVMNGMTLSEAFAAQVDKKGKAIFPVTFVCALRIGEEVGTASDSAGGESKNAFTLTLHRFAEAEKKADAIRGKIRSALMYPIAVIGFCIIAIAAVLYFVMPKMVDLYSSLLSGPDAQLPLITRVLIGASDFLMTPSGIGLVGGIVFALVMFGRWLKTPKGDDWLGRKILRMPVFGSFFRLFYAAQVLRTLAMLSAGIPSMTERFQIAADTCTNPEYKEMLQHVRHRFMIDSTDLAKLFSPYTFLMGKEFGGVLMTYEKTADMEDTFHNYAKLVEIRAERELEAVLFWLQNFAIVPVGIFIGFIVTALYSPMFSLAGKIGSQ